VCRGSGAGAAANNRLAGYPLAVGVFVKALELRQGQEGFVEGKGERERERERKRERNRRRFITTVRVRVFVRECMCARTANIERVGKKCVTE
jgi:hypothetical protein